MNEQLNGKRVEKADVDEEDEHYIGVNDVPSIGVSLLYGFQQTMMGLSGILVIPFMVSDIVCAGSSAVALRAQLISITFFSCGIATLLQSTFGLRLPILHGSSLAFIPPLTAFKNLPENACNATDDDDVPDELWQGQMREIQGSLLVGCCIFVFLGVTGLAGKLSKVVGPITIVPLLLLLALSVVPTVKDDMQKHWVSLVTFACLILTGLYLENFIVPIPYYSFKAKKMEFIKSRLFGRFPYLLSISFAWFLCYILTVSGAVDKESNASTARNKTSYVLHEAPWIHFPLPGIWGAPSIRIGLLLGFIASCISSVLENIGSYAMLARICKQKPPPSDAVNRGIITEGISSIIAAALGGGTGVTTFAENIALIHITRVACRTTMQAAGIILILMGVFTKIAALLATIPDPVIGGILAMGMSMIAGVALANLKIVDLGLTRNLTIMGVAIMFGMVIPMYFTEHPFNTGIQNLDEAVNILMNIQMLVGGTIACFLDNTVPGATKAQRGIHCKTDEPEDVGLTEEGYAFPEFVERIFDFWILRKLPFIPPRRRALQTSESDEETQNESKLVLDSGFQSLWNDDVVVSKV